MDRQCIVKPLAKPQKLQLWQAFAVLNAETVKKEVDIKYLEYTQEALNAGAKTLMCRLTFMKNISLEMYGKCDEETQEMVKRRMADNTIKIAAYLLEVQETLSAEEAKRYLKNHRMQT